MNSAPNLLKLMFVFKLLFKLVVILVFLAIFALVVLIDPNDYKPQMTQFFKEQTGRTLTIDGSIRFTFFPWLGLELAKITIGNAQGFENKIFASANNAKVRVKLLPLFQKHIESDTVTLDGFYLFLTRRPDGSNNWDDLRAKNSSPTSSTPIKSFNIDQLNLNAATIVWDDHSLGLFYHITHLQLQTKQVNFEKPFEIKADFDLASKKMPAFTSRLNATAQARIDLSKQLFTLNPLQVNGHIQFTEIPILKQNVAATTQLILDLAHKVFKLDALTLQTLNKVIAMKGRLEVTDIFNKQLVSGQLNILPLKLTDAVKTLGLPLPPNLTLNAVKTAFLETDFKMKMEDKRINLNKLNLGVDNHAVKIPKLEFSPLKQTLDIAAFSAQIQGVNASGGISATQLFAQPLVDGELSLKTDDLSKLIKQFASTKYPLSPPFNFKKASLQTAFRGSATAVTLTGVQCQADTHSLTTPQVQFDLSKDALAVEDLVLKAFGLELTSRLTAENVRSQPRGQGYLKLAPFNPRYVLQRVGQEALLKAVEKNLLTSASLETQWQGDSTQFQMENLKLQLDNSQINGYFKAVNFDIPTVNFDLSANELDLDKYQVLIAQKNKAASSEPFVFPVKFLRDLNLHGTLNVGQLKVAKTVLQKIKLVTSATAGQLKLQAELEAYQGQFNGNVALNVQGEKPALEFNQTLQHLQLTPLLKTFAVTTPASGVMDATAQLTATLDLQKQILQVAPLQVTAQLANSDWVTGRQTVSLKTSDLQIDFARQELKTPSVSLQGMGVDLQTRFQGSFTQIAGELTLAPLNLKTVLEQVKQPLPLLKDPNVLKKVALTTQFQGNLSEVKLKNLKLRLDESQLQGYFTLRDFKQPFINFEAEVDTLDVDRYLPVTEAKKTKTGKSNETLLPLEMLQTLNLNGVLKIAQLKIAQLKITQVQLVISSKEGKIKISPQAHFYEGIYRGQSTLDVQTTPPNLSTDEHLEKVQLGALLKDLFGKALIQGVADLTVQLSADVTTAESLSKTLAGTIANRLTNGRIENIDFVHSIRQVKAILQDKPPPPRPSVVETKFVTLQSMLIANKEGWQIEDFALESPVLRVRGQGKIFAENQMDCLFTSEMIGQKDTDLKELHGITIPIRVIGPLLKPKIQPDLKVWFLNYTRQKLAEKYPNKLNKDWLDLLENLNVEDFLK